MAPGLNFQADAARGLPSPQQPQPLLLCFERRNIPGPRGMPAVETANRVCSSISMMCVGHLLELRFFATKSKVYPLIHHDANLSTRFLSPTSALALHLPSSAQWYSWSTLQADLQSFSTHCLENLDCTLARAVEAAGVHLPSQSPYPKIQRALMKQLEEPLAVKLERIFGGSYQAWIHSRSRTRTSATFASSARSTAFSKADFRGVVAN